MSIRFQLSILSLLSAICISSVAHAQFCPVPTPPAIAPLTGCPTGSVQITSLPYTISASGNGQTFCLAFSPPSTNSGGITISSASNITLDGAGRTIYGGVTVTSSSNVVVKNFLSNKSFNIMPSASAPSQNVTLQRSSFAGLNSPGGDNPLNGVTVQDSRFVCNCNQQPTDNQSTDNYCVFLQSEVYGSVIDNLLFERNFIESDCSKNMKVMAKVPAKSGQSVKHIIRNNYFHALRIYPANEVSSFTWRNSPGAASDPNRNVFSNNTLISEGHSSGMYLRDDQDNVDITNNCIEIKNPSGNGVWLGGIGTASGNLDTSFSSGLKLLNNRIKVRGGPAVGLQAADENPVSANNRNTFRYNLLIATSGDPAAKIGGGGGGALWDHNTFYAAVGNGQAVEYDMTPITDQVEFTNNIFGCARLTSDNRKECLKTSFAQTKYTGHHNLFYNFAALPVEIYGGYDVYQIPLSRWISVLGEDPNSLQADPLFVNRGNYDLRLTSSSPARGMASDGGDVGALPFGSGSQPDLTSPGAPLNLSVQP